ncbi:MAG TPA: L-2-hydroxyglutarate oxidase [Acidobacteriota bacterium]
MKTLRCHFLIVGAGIIGLTIARELAGRGAKDIIVMEKEEAPGLHASGRNSGILHAGIYYSSDSLKARFCVEGNRSMKKFCRQKSLALYESGKVIVAQDESELQRLYELKKRADLNGAKAVLISEQQLAELEPHARTYREALYAPETAVIDAAEVMKALERDVLQTGKVTILYRTPLTAFSAERTADTRSGPIVFEKLINAAGTFADEIAHLFDVASEYQILPFKGTYKRLVPQRSFLARGNIYPVPDLENPFLGVHFSRKVDGQVFIGPTAIPAFGRENYDMMPHGFRETGSIFYRDAILWLRNRAFRRKALSEVKKYSRRIVHREAKKLVPELRLEDLENSSKVGIRAQLVHWPTKKLVMDFVVLECADSIHILNAVSPAFTCSMAFAKHIADLCVTPSSQ